MMAAAIAASLETSGVHDRGLKLLLDMGYDVDTARGMLECSNGDVNVAINLLLEDGDNSGSRAPQPASA